LQFADKGGCCTRNDDSVLTFMKDVCLPPLAGGSRSITRHSTGFTAAAAAAAQGGDACTQVDATELNPTRNGVGCYITGRARGGWENVVYRNSVRPCGNNSEFRNPGNPEIPEISYLQCLVLGVPPVLVPASFLRD
jgi:hypothetical protein